MHPFEARNDMESNHEGVVVRLRNIDDDRGQLELHGRGDTKPAAAGTVRAYASKQQEWREFCDQERFEDRYLVYEQKLIKFLDTRVLSRSTKRHKRAHLSSQAAAKDHKQLSKNTIKAYVAAIVNLYEEQRDAGVNLHPHPRGDWIRAKIGSIPDNDEPEHRRRNPAKNHHQQSASPSESGSTTSGQQARPPSRPPSRQQQQQQQQHSDSQSLRLTTADVENSNFNDLTRTLSGVVDATGHDMLEPSNHTANTTTTATESIHAVATPATTMTTDDAHLTSSKSPNLQPGGLSRLRRRTHRSIFINDGADHDHAAAAGVAMQSEFVIPADFYKEIATLSSTVTQSVQSLETSLTSVIREQGLQIAQLRQQVEILTGQAQAPAISTSTATTTTNASHLGAHHNRNHHPPAAPPHVEVSFPAIHHNSHPPYSEPAYQ
ncbi:hypothetical protein V1514DRAFT_319899 [Lipomyces japonicus]|uniref:uncharacterized protein n=1 Tax=Lipomyces japonicus TaxID=56871 RepID=UPI0034CD0BF7